MVTITTPHPPHNLLDGDHIQDTEAKSPSIGDLIYGVGAPPTKWDRLAIGAANKVLTVKSGIPSWETAAAGGAHDLLDGSTIQDSVTQAVSRGSLIYGNATPKWDELVLGAGGTRLKSDGTDATWAVVPAELSATMRALTLTFNQTYYYNFNQSGALQTTENQCWIYVPFPCTIRNFYVYVISNTLDGNTVVHVRKNGADTALVVTIAAAATGSQTDVANSDTFAAGDYRTVDFDTTASTSGSLKIGAISIQCEPS